MPRPNWLRIKNPLDGAVFNPGQEIKVEIDGDSGDTVGHLKRKTMLLVIVCFRVDGFPFHEVICNALATEFDHADKRPFAKDVLFHGVCCTSGCVHVLAWDKRNPPASFTDIVLKKVRFKVR